MKMKMRLKRSFVHETVIHSKSYYMRTSIFHAYHGPSVCYRYSNRDYFTSSNLRNIFRQCGFFGFSGAKSVEQAHFFVKGLLTVYHLERMLQNSSDVSQNPAQTFLPRVPDDGKVLKFIDFSCAKSCVKHTAPSEPSEHCDLYCL